MDGFWNMKKYLWNGSLKNFEIMDRRVRRMLGKVVKAIWFGHYEYRL